MPRKGTLVTPLGLTPAQMQAQIDKAVADRLAEMPGAVNLEPVMSLIEQAKEEALAKAAEAEEKAIAAEKRAENAQGMARRRDEAVDAQQALIDAQAQRFDSVEELAAEYLGALSESKGDRKQINERLAALEARPAPKDGYTPIKGVDYFDGERGPQGTPGKDGRDGTDGAQGPPGASVIGPKGDTGARGEKGDTGAASTVPGPKGDTGLQGPKGDTGARGETGLAGVKGDKGDTGAPSTVAGPKGDKGDTGAAGKDAAPVLTGSKTETMPLVALGGLYAFDIPVTGAKVGMPCQIVYPTGFLDGLSYLGAQVEADGFVKVRLKSGLVLAAGSRMFKAYVWGVTG